MSEFKFSRTSKRNLKTCHPDLQLIMKEALLLSEVDFGISEGHRSTERQQQLYREGKSMVDGIHQRSRHQSDPSEACDVFAYVDGKANYEEENMRKIWKAVDFIARQLEVSGKVSHVVEWGGNWRRFVDMPHFQLKKI